MNINTAKSAVTIAALLLPIAYGQAQDDSELNEDDIFTLSPFEVVGSEAEGYNAETTLAGNRLRTNLRDVGSAVSVVTEQFLKDVGATDNASLLVYALGAEVGGMEGNFAGTGDTAILNEDTIRPNENTRIRGLAAADNTRGFFRSEIPWDSYNTERIDIQRGPNSILFGQGSPAGIINASLRGAYFHNAGDVEARFGSYGGWRASLNVNRELVEDEVAIRISALHKDEKFQQKPAFSKDDRIYVALRIEPKFLNQGGLRTIFKGNYENGNIDSNNPRQLTPVDTITPWFTELNQETYESYQLWDHLSGRPNHGQERPVLVSNEPNPAYTPWIGGFGMPTVEAQPVAFFDGNGNQSLWITEASASMLPNAIAADGSVDGGIDAMPHQRFRAINPASFWAAEAGLPYSSAGIFKDNLLTDSSVFNFYNNLIDGDTKREWQDFDVLNLSLSQTYFEDKMGISLDYNSESYESGQSALFGGNVALAIDPMAVYADGTPDTGLTGEPYSDGTPNPNVGRPFVVSTGQGGNHSYSSEREAKRATAFLTHDFREGKESVLTDILGTHTITGLLSDESWESESRSWQRYGIFDDAAYTELANQALSTGFDHVWMTPTSVMYLGDSLLGKSASGANIPRLSGNPTFQSGAINYFDDSWRWSMAPGDAGYVDPAAPWSNGFYPEGHEGRISTQSENPANYVGWTTFPLEITDAESSSANRDKLTTNASLTKSITKSEALVWQGKLLNDSIVGMYGWRKDTNESYAHSLSTATGTGSHRQVDLSPGNYKLPRNYDNRVEVQSHSYSIVAHLNDLPGLSRPMEKLPFQLSLFYNKSSNFKPDASRVDLLGESIASPSGKTIDKGIMVESNDGKYSFKLNYYNTKVQNGSSSYGNAAAIGNWMTMGANFANVFEYDIGNSSYIASPENIGAGNPQRFDFQFADGTWDTVGEAAAITGYRDFQRAVDPRFYDAWSMNVQGFGPPAAEVTYSTPNGFTVTEDSVSKGWEFEFSMQPTKNWRITANATKQEATRYNVGGANMIEFMDLVASAVAGDAGQLHFWWGTEDVPRTVNTWYESYIGGPGSEWASKKLLEGTLVPELREWRFNLVTNYDFTESRLKGFNVGGGIRYQGGVSIGYPPTGDPTDPAAIGFDLDNPYQGPSETNFDLWLGYSKQISDKIFWNIQLNVRNAFASDELIPITAQAPIPGQPFSAAAWRIAPSRTWFLTNRFEF